MNTYQYFITDMNRNADGIVISVSFTVTASDGTDNFTHNFYTGLTPPNKNPIPFEQLKESDVIGWVKSLVQQESEAQADAELAAYKIRKNQIVSNGTPWSA